VTLKAGKKIFQTCQLKILTTTLRLMFNDIEKMPKEAQGYLDF
jgi:hypothetical protein